ncbi:AlwI family type II restriction endonuclease [Limosilactobacillus reuteri]|uniref:AlwI family type II restriction endonuclease n=1 Tax=Limosilactobacillus reuteri TaxID=1598 RepID=A0A7X2G1W3_LIMRT|nr:AlwI family type II restriction endonuclease [Limosilactobacillus reuteri]MRG90182.1 AlwI family type II restriction endonuclease [Limosilactobacillus reuteri]
MDISKNGQLINLGDKSFTRKDYLESFPELLRILDKYKNIEWNSDTQASYYQDVLNETNLFNRNEPSSKFAQRGRTMANAISKIGLVETKMINGKKVKLPSEVGNNWVDNNYLPYQDEFEQLFNFNKDNLVFWRQLIKLRVFYKPEVKKTLNKNGDNFTFRYVKPFIFGLKLLKKFNKINKHDFCGMVLALRPDMTEDRLNSIIDNYSKVYSKSLDFNSFFMKEYSNYFIDTKNLSLASRWFDQSELDFNVFNNQLGYKGAPPKTKKKEFEFIEALKKFQTNKNEQSLEQLKGLSKKDQSKKAFGFGKEPFKFSNAHKRQSVDEFLKANDKSPLLTADGATLYKIYMVSKTFNNMSEYGDLTLRYFNLSGIVNIEASTISLNILVFFKELFNVCNISMSGEISDKEKNNKAFCSNSQTTEDIFELSKKDIKSLKANLFSKYKVNKISDLREQIEIEKDMAFVKFINNKFNKDKTIKILQHIRDRNRPGDKADKWLQSNVTNQATTPTIYEFMLGIAWYHLSKGKLIRIRRDYNLTLGGNMLPLRHANGGEGDIEVKYKRSKNFPYDGVLLEATLMDKSTQKRGEMEPVIRHTVNLNTDNQKWYGMFVGNVLDENVVNIFHLLSNVQLHDSRNKDKSVNGVNIFALTIDELIEFLKKNITDQEIINTFCRNIIYNKPINSDWRKEVIKEIEQDYHIE